MIISLIIASNIQLSSWVFVGQQSVHILQEVHRVIPYFRHGTFFVTSGIPHYYKGKQLYGIGLDAALFTHYGLLAQWWPGFFSPIRYDINADMYIIHVDLDEENHNFDVKHANGVTLSDDALQKIQIPYNAIHDDHWVYHMNADNGLEEYPHTQPCFLNVREWDFTDCAYVEEWKYYNLTEKCEQGVGLHLFSQNNAAGYLVSSPFELSYEGWVEVIVRMSILDTNMEKNTFIQLSLNLPSDNKGKDTETHTIRLPQDSLERDYHFFTRVRKTELFPYTIKLVPINTQSHIALESVKIRSIP